jgi:HEAT repeat protein
MSHASAWVQYHAATALGRIGDARAAVALTDALSGTDESVRRASGDALVRIGQPSVEPLVMVLGEAARRSAARVEAARVLGEIADARAIGPLLMAVDSPDIGIKWEAMRALGHFRDRRVTQTLVAVLHAKAGKSKKERSLAPHTRRIAAEALGAAADPEAVAPLSAALKDPDLSVVIAAHTSLVLVGDPAVGPLIALLAGKDRALRTEAVEILSHIADRTGNRSALDAVLRVLAGTDAALRSSAVQALVTVKDRHALDEVVEALADKVSRVRWAALDALRSRSNAGANPLIADALIDALSHQTPLVRRAASVALQSISGKNYGEDREAWLFWKRNQP